MAPEHQNRLDNLDFSALLPDEGELELLIEDWLDEDIGHRDITTDFLIPRDAEAEFMLNTREDIVVCGMDIAEMIFRQHVLDCAVEIIAPDGTRAMAGEPLMRVTGPARGLLTAERTAINLAQFLTGISTLTAQYVDLVAGTGAVLIETRKTIPGYRALSKYATCVGGARNHRIRLDDGIIIKDNHIAIHGSISQAIRQAKALTPSLTKIEVEADTLEQVREAADAGCDVIMLDNMSAEMMRDAVEIANGRCEMEASGGINLETVRDKALSGVDYISVGRITHSAPAADIGLDVSIKS